MILQEIKPYKPRYVGLVVETNSKEPFMIEEPIKIMLSGHFNQVPFLIGYNTLEGAVVDLLKKPGQPEAPDFEQLIPWSFGYEVGSAESKAVAAKLQKFYFGDEDYSQQLLRKKYDVSITYELD